MKLLFFIAYKSRIISRFLLRTIKLFIYLFFAWHILQQLLIFFFKFNYSSTHPYTCILYNIILWNFKIIKSKYTTFFFLFQHCYIIFCKPRIALEQILCYIYTLKLESNFKTINLYIFYEKENLTQAKYILNILLRPNFCVSKILYWHFYNFMNCLFHV